MKTFKDYINIEEETIKKFIDVKEDITLNEIKNDSFSVYDFTFFSAGTYNEYFTKVIDGICEVKTRKTNHTNYPEGVILELKKLTSVLSEVALEKDNPDNINKTIKGYYLMEYLDKSFLFDLEQIDTKSIQFKKCPKYTANTSSPDFIYKPVVLIPFDQAILTY
jgi:hypothetical protein